MLALVLPKLITLLMLCSLHFFDISALNIYKSTKLFVHTELNTKYNHNNIRINNKLQAKRTKIAGYRTEERTRKIESVVQKRHKDFTIVAENIIDPHNISAVFRSCDAVGILEAHIVYDGSKPEPKLAESSSASARKWVDAKYYNNIDDCYAELRKQGKKIYTTHLTKNSISIYDLDLTEPFAIVVGNEHSGVTERAVELADANVLIPQVGMIQSLNISVACAVSIYEAFRQRLKAGKYDNIGLPEEEYQTKLKEWLEK